MSKFKEMSDEYLTSNYVPNVYQASIYAINYEKLKSSGIKLISFDIDDTIAALEKSDPPKAAITLFENLKNMGFELMLITNAGDSRGKHFSKALGVDYISRAKKPRTTHFQELQERYHLAKNQMAHVGNSITNDVAGGNAYGVTTCLVRNIGYLDKVGTKVKGVFGKTEGQKVRAELKSRNIWRKHHKYQKNDQYYQLGETPMYRSTMAQP